MLASLRAKECFCLYQQYYLYQQLVLVYVYGRCGVLFACPDLVVSMSPLVMIPVSSTAGGDAHELNRASRHSVGWGRTSMS